MAATEVVTRRAPARAVPRKRTSGPSRPNVLTGPGRDRCSCRSAGRSLRSTRACTVAATVARYYDPTTAQFLTRDPLEGLTQAPYSYANDDPLDQIDPLGLCGHWYDVACQVGSAASTVGGAVSSGAQWVADHPTETAGLVLGAAAAATGVGAVIEGATVVGLGLSAVSVGAGATAAGLDANKCFQGETVACVGFGLGGAAAVAGVFPVVGTTLILGGAIEEGALADALLNYLPAGFGLNLGLAGLSLDFASLFFGGDGNACA